MWKPPEEPAPEEPVAMGAAPEETIGAKPGESVGDEPAPEELGMEPNESAEEEPAPDELGMEPNESAPEEPTPDELGMEPGAGSGLETTEPMKPGSKRQPEAINSGVLRPASKRRAQEIQAAPSTIRKSFGGSAPPKTPALRQAWQIACDTWDDMVVPFFLDGTYPGGAVDGQRQLWCYVKTEVIAALKDDDVTTAEMLVKDIAERTAAQRAQDCQARLALSA